MPVVLRFRGAPDPDQPKPVLALLGAHGRCGVGVDPVGAIRTFHGKDDPPPCGLVAKLLAEIDILLPTPGQDGYELASEGVEVGQVLLGAKLAVRHVDEVILGKEVPKAIEVVFMETVVRLVPAEHSVGKWNRAIRGDVHPEHDLLEVWTMIFVVAFDDSGLPYRPPVLSKEGERGRIEVDPIRLQTEKLDRPKGELEEDSPTPVFCKLIEGPSNPIIIDGEFLVLRQPQGPGVDRIDPFAQTVEGVPRNKHVMHEHPNGFTMS